MNNRYPNLLRISLLFFFCNFFFFNLNAFPISDGDSTETEIQKEDVKFGSNVFSWTKGFAPNESTAEGIVVVQIIGLILTPVLLFVPFAWTLALGFFGIWLTFLILIGIAVIIQFVLLGVILEELSHASHGGFGPDLRGLGLAIFGGFFFWFSLVGGLICLIWGLIVNLAFLWIFGAAFLGLAFILLLILLLHPQID